MTVAAAPWRVWYVSRAVEGEPSEGFIRRGATTALAVGQRSARGVLGSRLLELYLPPRARSVALAALASVGTLAVFSGAHGPLPGGRGVGDLDVFPARQGLELGGTFVIRFMGAGALLCVAAAPFLFSATWQQMTPAQASDVSPGSVSQPRSWLSRSSPTPRSRSRTAAARFPTRDDCARPAVAGQPVDIVYGRFDSPLPATICSVVLAVGFTGTESLLDGAAAGRWSTRTLRTSTSHDRCRRRHARSVSTRSSNSPRIGRPEGTLGDRDVARASPGSPNERVLVQPVLEGSSSPRSSRSPSPSSRGSSPARSRWRTSSPRCSSCCSPGIAWRNDVRLTRTSPVAFAFFFAFALLYLAGFYSLDTPQALTQWTKGTVKFVLHFGFLVPGDSLLARRGHRFYWFALAAFFGGIALDAVYGVIQLFLAEAGVNLDQVLIQPITSRQTSINMFGAVNGTSIFRPNALTGDPNHLGIELLIPLLVLTPLYLRLEAVTG